MRIAVVTETWTPNVDGVVVRLENTVRHLRAAGHEVLVVAPVTGTEQAGVREHRTRSVRLGFVYGGQAWGVPDLGVRRALAEFDPDVVHVVNPVAMGAVALWLARSRYPVVASYHTDVVAYAGRYHLGWLEGALKTVMRRTYGRAAVRLATSEAGRSQLAAVGIEDVALWPRGVDEGLFRPGRDGAAMRERLNPHPEEPLVLSVGRLAAEKDLDRLLPLLDADPPVHLAFVGDGPDRQRLQRLFGSEHATFAGVLRGQELADAYAAADVFVFPSTTDTLGLVLLEAMACGVPVVASDTEAARETLAGYPHHVLVGNAATPTVEAAVDKAMTARARPGPEPALAATGSWRTATDHLLRAYAQARHRTLVEAPGHASRLSRFAAVGATNAGIDLAVFNLLLLLDPTRSPALLVAYNTCAVIAAIANSYVWNSRWTFRDRARGGLARRWRQRVLFALQGGINLTVNDVVVLVLSLLASWLGLRSSVAANGVKVVAMLSASAVSYVFMHYFVFPRRRAASHGTPGP
ncbi:MAG TPA: glycosyltransferase [Marmoricola sp.]|nr:glycosyltransferase [Marmoricola sp.]